MRFNLCQSHRRWGRTWIRHPFLKSKAQKFLFCDASSVHLLKGININMCHTEGYRLSQIYFKIRTTVVKKSSAHHCKTWALYWESLCLVAVTNSWGHKLCSERNRAGHQGQLTHIIFLFVGVQDSDLLPADRTNQRIHNCEKSSHWDSLACFTIFFYAHILFSI